jgi:hypothetical protein
LQRVRDRNLSLVIDPPPHLKIPLQMIVNAVPQERGRFSGLPRVRLAREQLVDEVCGVEC